VNEGDLLGEARDSRSQFIESIGQSKSYFVRALVTALFSKRFHKAYFAGTQRLKPFSGTGTISFDCDHSPDIAALPQLLSILSRCHVRATFSCVGKLVELHPVEHSAILEEGHEIMNHTFSHPFNEELNSTNRFDRLSTEAQTEEIVKCHESCKSILRYEPKGFRTPHFAVQHTKAIYDILPKLGYKYSSSTLAVGCTSHGMPFKEGEILEFPVSVCPKHPFQAFDTYHAFRSRITKHRNEEDFLNEFAGIVDFCSKRGIYVNFYFDPQDVVTIRGFEKALMTVKENLDMLTYEQLYSRWHHEA